MALPKMEKLLRNSFFCVGEMQIPVIYRDDIDLKDISLIGYHNTKNHDKSNTEKTVHFFIDDEKFDYIPNNPKKYHGKLKQYKQIISPDLSVYTDMPVWKQISNIALSYYTGAYWQKLGSKIIANATWGGPETFRYCFDGIDEYAVVALSTIQTKKNCKELFMMGFKELCKRKKPTYVICYGSKPYDEMYQLANIIYKPHEGNAKRKQLHQYYPNQQDLFDWKNEKQIS